MKGVFIMSVEHLVSKAIKRIGNVHPVVKQGAEEIIRRAYKEGIYVLFNAGFRSYAEQNALYAQGRTKAGNIVTNARGGQSYHNFGLALDFFLTNKEGTTASWTYNSDWKRVAEIAKSLGFEWGGDWRSFVDRAHFQMTGGLSLAQLRAGAKPNLKLKTQSSAPPKKQTVTAGSSKAPKASNQKWTKVTGNWTGQTLKEGQFGVPVKQLQTMLANNNPPFYPDKGAKNNGVDSYYGKNTKDAVRRYQSYYGLAVDGLAGKEVYNSLNNKKASSTPTPKKAKKKYPLPSGVLRRGSKGNNVKQLQRALNAANFKVGKVDGDYGSKTEDAVRRFQMVHDAHSVDGVYGPRTKTRLNKVVN